MANILETVVFADGETANTQQATGTQTAADPNACLLYTSRNNCHRGKH